MTIPALTSSEIQERRRKRIEAILVRIQGKTFPSGYVRSEAQRTLNQPER